MSQFWLHSCVCVFGYMCSVYLSSLLYFLHIHPYLASIFLHTFINLLSLYPLNSFFLYLSPLPALLSAGWLGTAAVCHACQTNIQCKKANSSHSLPSFVLPLQLPYYSSPIVKLSAIWWPCLAAWWRWTILSSVSYLRHRWQCLVAALIWLRALGSWSGREKRD